MIDTLRLHRIAAGHYRNVAGHEVWLLTTDDDSRIPTTPWRLTGREGWYGDHATLRDAQASIRESGR